jgi:ClpP class serine protease
VAPSAIGSEPIRMDNAPFAPSAASSVAEIVVRGPLSSHGDYGCCSYDAIRSATADACRGAADVVLLRVDSPGGDVSGCFELARDIRAMIVASGKRSAAYVDGSACSAAYAIATAFGEIYCPTSAAVGSIGVIHVRPDTSAMDASMGIRFAVTVSGDRKSDGAPFLPVSDAELAETQRTVDALAVEFYGLVESMRGGKLPSSRSASLQARVLYGAEAIAVGLVDVVATYDQTIAALSKGMLMDDKKDEKNDDMESIRSSLARMAEGDGDNADAAKRALAALDQVDGGDDEPPEPAQAMRHAAEGLAVVQQLAADVARIQGQLDAERRDALLASRPDLSAEARKLLSSRSPSEIRAILSVMPAANRAAATAQVPATRGSNDARSPTAMSDEASKMDDVMGITKMALGSRRNGNTVEFGIMSQRSGDK